MPFSLFLVWVGILGVICSYSTGFSQKGRGANGSDQLFYYWAPTNRGVSRPVMNGSALEGFHMRCCLDTTLNAGVEVPLMVH